MNSKKNNNIIKGEALRYLTGSFKNKKNKTFRNNDEVRRILICRPNHRLGNLLLLTPLLQELESTFPNSKIDLLVNQSCAGLLFQNYENVNQVFEFPRNPFTDPIKYINTFIRLRSNKYDLAINAVKDSSWGRIFTSISNVQFRFFGDGVTDNKEQHIAKQIICCLRDFLPTIGVKANDAIVPELDLRLANHELIDAGILVYNMLENTQLTICLSTDATSDSCNTERWWLNLYEHLQRAFPDANIIEVLPTKNVSGIGFRAPVLYSEDIRELAAMIANTDVFIGTDNGVMHLASASLTPTIGLFTTIEIEKYRPYNEGSAAIKTSELEIDELIVLIKNALYPNINTAALDL